MNSICVMLDDVLVTGKDDDEHLHNLEEVFHKVWSTSKEKNVLSCNCQSSIMGYVYQKRK